MASRSILNSTDELDSSMYPSFDIPDQETTPQDTPSLEEFMTLRHPNDQPTRVPEQQSFQQHDRLVDIRREHSNSYRLSRHLQVPSRTNSYSPYTIPSQEANRPRSNTLTSGYTTSATPSMALSTEDIIDSTAPSATSYTLGKMPEPLRHAPSGLSSVSSVATVTSPLENSATAKKARASTVSLIKSQRKARRSRSVPPPKPTLDIDLTSVPLTEEQKKANSEIAVKFIANWNAKQSAKRERSSKKERSAKADMVVPISEEWNPAQQGHKLIDLDLPSLMLLDCIFDPRHLDTEDVTNTVSHGDDPLVELFCTCARVELMAQVHIHWRGLRENDDASLRKHLDLLAELNDSGAIKPFFPVATYLNQWSEWQTCCRLAGSTGLDDSGKHVRPKIHKNRMWLTSLGATQLGELAEQKLKDLLKAKGMEGAWELEFMRRLAAIKDQIAVLCEKRDSPFLLDVEGLELLKAAYNE
jgi:hypothetical protein